MRKFIVLLLLAALASGTFDQTYVQTLADNGSSVIVKTQDLSVFSGSVSFPALSRACADLTNVQCLVSGQTMMISDSFAPDGSYYTYASDGGFPFITRTLLISRVPNDVFGADLSKVLDAANFTSTGGQSSVIDLTADNSGVVSALRQFDVNLTYVVNTPAVVSEAYSGNLSGSISGERVTFNLIDVMATGQPIVIKTQELNVGALVLIIGVVVLAGLAYAFFVTSRKNEKAPRPLKRKTAK